MINVWVVFIYARARSIAKRMTAGVANVEEVDVSSIGGSVATGGSVAGAVVAGGSVGGGGAVVVGYS